jgi:hypothetical protein
MLFLTVARPGMVSRSHARTEPTADQAFGRSGFGPSGPERSTAGIGSYLYRRKPARE